MAIDMKLHRSPPRLSVDHGRTNRVTAPLQRLQVAFATVGYPLEGGVDADPTPAFVHLREGQAYVEVTTQHDDRIVARLDTRSVFTPLAFGCQVIVVYPDGEPTSATIVACLDDATRPLPDEVAGVSTGAAQATERQTRVPAPAWQFTRLADGQLLAIETQGTGDVLIHSGSGVEIKGATIMLDGRVALGEGATTAPIGATVGPAGTTIPGVPAVPPIPTPASPPTPAPPLTIVPYAGFEDGILRAKDDIQSHAGTDPGFWTHYTAMANSPFVFAFAGLPPISLHAKAGGLTGPGSQHTASD